MKASYTSLTCETDYFSTRQDGAIVFFRPKGNQLLANENITANDALSWGIVNRCVPVENLEEAALSTARRFAALPESSLVMAKRLVNNASKDLRKYLECENRELTRSLIRQRELAPQSI